MEPHSCFCKIYILWVASLYKYQRLPNFGTLRETGKEEDREIAGEDR